PAHARRHLQARRGLQLPPHRGRLRHARLHGSCDLRCDTRRLRRDRMLRRHDDRRAARPHGTRIEGGGMTASYIYDAVRTPFGRAGGALAGVRPDDLAAVVMRATVERTGLDPARIDDVIFGDANQAGEDNRDVARFGALLAGFPTSVPGVTVNRLCGSAVEAVIQGSRAIETGDATLVLAGGVESMSRAPFVVEKSPKPWPASGNPTMWNTSIGWRMVNPALPAEWTISNGQSAEKLAGIHGISREAQDAFALRSHHLAAEAWDAGIYAPEIVQVPGAELARDEGIRADTSLEKLGGLRALFAADGTVTA